LRLPQLIEHTIKNFNIAPDKQAVSRINESLSTLGQARDLRAREAEDAIRRRINPQNIYRKSLSFLFSDKLNFQVLHAPSRRNTPNTKN
jgi:kinetochore protein Spc24